MITALHGIAFKAPSHPRHRFQDLYGLLKTDLLYQSWGQLNKQAASGIDGITPSMYESNLPESIQRLESQLKAKRYRAATIKRVYIPNEWKATATGLAHGRRQSRTAKRESGSSKYLES